MTTHTDLAAEAMELAEVLRGMTECGAAPDDLWERDQPDGDPFVARAAELLEALAALAAPPAAAEQGLGASPSGTALYAPAPSGRPLQSHGAEDTARINWLEQLDGRFYNIDRISAIKGSGFTSRERVGWTKSLREAIDAARGIGAEGQDAQRLGAEPAEPGAAGTRPEQVSQVSAQGVEALTLLLAAARAVTRADDDHELTQEHIEHLRLRCQQAESSLSQLKGGE